MALKGTVPRFFVFAVATCLVLNLAACSFAPKPSPYTRGDLGSLLKRLDADGAKEDPLSANSNSALKALYQHTVVRPDGCQDVLSVLWEEPFTFKEALASPDYAESAEIQEGPPPGHLGHVAPVWNVDVRVFENKTMAASYLAHIKNLLSRCAKFTFSNPKTYEAKLGPLDDKPHSSPVMQFVGRQSAGDPAYTSGLIEKGNLVFLFTQTDPSIDDQVTSDLGRFAEAIGP